MIPTKREQLKEKVVALVKEFIKTEGGISQDDLQVLFGNPIDPQNTREFIMLGVAAALREIPVSFSEQKPTDTSRVH
jgi:hypothetical protein